MTNKQQHIITLTGMINGKPATTHQAADVIMFHGDSPTGNKNYFKVDHSIQGTPVLTTPKGEYLLLWNNAGFFEPQFPPNGITIHVSLKKITGNLIYWV